MLSIPWYGQASTHIPCRQSYNYRYVAYISVCSLRYIFRRLSAILSSDFVVRFCRQILSSDSVVRFCLLKLSKYFYRAVCKTNTRTPVGDLSTLTCSLDLNQASCARLIIAKKLHVRAGRLLLIQFPLCTHFSSSGLAFRSKNWYYLTSTNLKWWDLSLLVPDVPLVPAIKGISFRKLEVVRQSG